MIGRALVCAFALSIPGWGVLADTARGADLEALFAALDVRETVLVMEEEGAIYGDQIAAEMLPEADAGGWSATVARIYNADRMQRLVEAELGKALDGVEIDPLLAFFTSDLGTRVIALELAARRAFMDAAVEEAAMLRADKAQENGDAMMALVEAIIEDSDLIELNVIGSLNSNLMFYRGLSDGGAIEISEADMLGDVWALEESSRAETDEWLHAFLLLAYDPLTEDELSQYAALYRSVQGQQLNAALFQAYNQMYDELSYLLGQAVAGHMNSAPL